MLSSRKPIQMNWFHHLEGEKIKLPIGCAWAGQPAAGASGHCREKKSMSIYPLATDFRESLAMQERHGD